MDRISQMTVLDVNEIPSEDCEGQMKPVLIRYGDENGFATARRKLRCFSCEKDTELPLDIEAQLDGRPKLI